MNNHALEIKNLNMDLGSFALSDISLCIEKGTIMGLVGKNGAGKTTLIRSILNLIPRKSGEVNFDGIELFGHEEIVKTKVGVVFDNLIFPLNLKPVKIKNMLSPFYRTFDHDRYNSLMKRFELDPQKKLSAYSKGMQMKFGIVMALCYNPDLIILDEPTAGLDPIARADLIDLLQEILQDERKSVLFSTHITSDLDKIADYITLIDHGKILFSQSKEDLIEGYALCSVNKEEMTDSLKSQLLGLRETAFTFEGLTRNRKELSDIAGVKMAKANVEDIMVFLIGKRGGQND